MEHLNLVETFSEFKEFKNIDRETMMSILEDVFKHMLTKRFGSADNFDIIVNIDKGDLEIFRSRVIVEDGAVEADRHLPVLIDHGLVPGRGGVYDGQPPVGEPQVVVYEIALVVRAAVGQGAGHALKRLWRHRLPAV